MASLSGRIASDQEPLYTSMNTQTTSSLTPNTNPNLNSDTNTSTAPPSPPVLTSISSSQAAAQLNDSSNTGAASILSQSAHPGALVFLYLFRSAAVATYLFCGFVSSSYVFSTVLVVVLLSLDFWTVRNVSGRRLVGLRFWSQVDEDGTAFWVFESRSVSSSKDREKDWLYGLCRCSPSPVRTTQPDQVANAIDTKMFWIALYTVSHLHLCDKKSGSIDKLTRDHSPHVQFPVIWIALFFVGLLKFNLSFLPIVALALVFNLTNAVGYTYDAHPWNLLSQLSGSRKFLGYGPFGQHHVNPSLISPSHRHQDRDAKRRWATGVGMSGLLGSVGGLGGSMVTGLASNAFSRFFK
ncbi:BQ2448_220 [Microbotryum intermedium]|uniref:Golgi apparatus membrane protein TVP23 n=1 Tax=Microbotryum intermedium TaxID=269621 RepID=A0A238F5T3_9BASI|nr:BQ2448_220 [Microbotryum intermedium]